MSRKFVAVFDHEGIALRDTVSSISKSRGWEMIEIHSGFPEDGDYPDLAWLGAQKILKGEAERGIFVSGFGVGISIAANKIPGIYAAVCPNSVSAEIGVDQDGMNVLCLGSKTIQPSLAAAQILAFLSAEPKESHRFVKIRAIESGQYSLDPTTIRLRKQGISIWYNGFDRSQVENGDLEQLIDQGIIAGVTSNPTHFHRSLAQYHDYENAIFSAVTAGCSDDELFTHLVSEDIRRIADFFRNLYITSNGVDGYVSYEVNPRLANNTQAIIESAKKFWTLVNRPNLMIKIPSGEAAIPAITELTEKGINLNITPVFSEETYRSAVDAYMIGLEKRLGAGLSIENIHSVISVLVSRIDRRIDPMLSEKFENLKGQTAITWSHHLYTVYQDYNSSERAETIRKRGGNPIRLLWSSTNPRELPYPKTKYVQALLGKDTICSVHPEILSEIENHMNVMSVLSSSDPLSDTFLTDLSAAGINLTNILKDLEKEGLDAFRKAYDTMLEEINARSAVIRGMEGSLRDAVEDTFTKLESESIVSRMFAKDPTIWTFDTSAFAEIRNRLGWLDTYTATEKALPEYLAIRESLKADGIKKILLLGMGGSSLCPEVLSLVFDDEADLKLQIVDSTDPDQVLRANADHEQEETVYIVSSKSGSTAEVRAFLDFFYDQAVQKLGDKAGSHFIAITDPGTGLERTATEMNFRNIILSDASVGGRFSALTPFGVAPAVLMGLDGEKIIAKAAAMAKICAPASPLSRNEGAALGVYMGTAALNGVDKITIITDSGLESFGSWLEQLIAESSGKNGKGIVPVDIEPKAEAYGNDRAFVYVKLGGEQQQFIEEIVSAGHPVFTITMTDRYDLFAEFYRWEIAVSIACALLEVNAFDQPNVQDSKTRTVAKVNEYHEKGELVQPAYNWEKDGIRAFYELRNAEMDSAKTVAELVDAFIKTAQPGTDYIAINAYLPRNAETLAALQSVRKGILEKTGCATTLGFGPRFQHSTGQLHKGGANNGLFIQLVWNGKEDAEIPNEDLKFSVLERAQAFGDFESLLANGRRAVRIDLGDKGIESLK